MLSDLHRPLSIGQDIVWKAGENIIHNDDPQLPGLYNTLAYVIFLAAEKSSLFRHQPAWSRIVRRAGLPAGDPLRLLRGESRGCFRTLLH